MAALLAILLLLLVAVPAAAHTRLVRADPAPRAALAAPPGRVVLRFSDPVELRFSTLTVETADGLAVDSHDARTDADEPRRLSVGLPPALPPGVYTVRYRVLSADGHVVSGSYRFTLAGR
jgi:methionine-rich copper-binding protein CopC